MQNSESNFKTQNETKLGQKAQCALVCEKQDKWQVDPGLYIEATFPPLTDKHRQMFASRRKRMSNSLKALWKGAIYR